ncbi:peroxisomal N(1)-acetyl-spermine/spermidine oxidase-like isoform X2 [Zootermopsis nevadensis]|nr:peroxisomal N(1)-acetyl-spermine/spermidine oxidase-like isoform X2 [Zootermopsis nevadensis]XP_021913726.1 peroxisomal N(1)-acetyl-spermine/spermidine oxidase-like isoform X2 [Zootermopsis nevadensis]
MAGQLQLLTNYEESKPDIIFIDPSGNLVNRNVASKVYHLLNDIRDSMARDIHNYSGSLGEYFNQQYRRKMDEHSLSNFSLARPLLQWYHRFRNEDSPNSWFETSSCGETEYLECEKSQLWSWKFGGYATVFDLLMQSIPDPKEELPVKYKIHYHNEVAKIKWDNLPEEYMNKVIVECSDGISYLADFVLVTVSLGVMKEKAQTMFQPVLPSTKLNAIKGLGFGVVDKIFLKFPHRWWPDNYTNFGFLWPHDDACNLNSVKQEDCWDRALNKFSEVDNLPLILCGWLSGPAARYMEQLSDEEVKHKVVQLLDRFIGKTFNVTVPAPDLFLRSAWSSDPHFRGSHSFYSTETEKIGVSAAQLAEPVTNKNRKPVLLFAGEATHTSHYSTVHGAIESGWREAERIIELSKLWKQ